MHQRSRHTNIFLSSFVRFFFQNCFHHAFLKSYMMRIISLCLLSYSSFEEVAVYFFHAKSVNFSTKQFCKGCFSFAEDVRCLSFI